MRSLSQSEGWMFKRCRRRWWLSYVRRLTPRRGDVAFARDVGSFVHGAAAEWYKGNDKDAVLAALDLALAKERERVYATETVEGEDDITANVYSDEERKDWDKVEAYSRIMVEGFIEWIEEEGVDVGLENFEPEVEVAVPFLEGVQLVGKQDARMRNAETGRLLFNELKTVGNFPDYEKTAHINEQLLHYHLLEELRKQEDERTAGAVVTMIRRVKRTATAKPPFFKRIMVYHSQNELRSYYARVAGMWEDMKYVMARLDEGVDPLHVVYPTPDKTCSWQCPFFKVCPMFDDPSLDAEGFLAEFFEDGDPYARYDTATEEG